MTGEGRFDLAMRHAADSSDQLEFMAFYQRGWDDMTEGRDTEGRFERLTRPVSTGRVEAPQLAPAAAVAGYLEGLAAARAQAQRTTGRIARTGGRRG